MERAAASRPRGTTATTSTTEQVLAHITTLREHSKEERRKLGATRERLERERILLAEEEKEKEVKDGSADFKTDSIGRLKNEEDEDLDAPSSHSGKKEGDTELFAILREFEELEANEEDAVLAWTQGVVRAEDVTDARPYLQFSLPQSVPLQSVSPRSESDSNIASSSERAALLSELMTLERQIGDERDEIFSDRANFERHRRLLEVELRERLSSSFDVDRRDFIDSKESPASSTASTSTGPAITSADKGHGRWGDFRASVKVGDKLQSLRRQQTFLGTTRAAPTPKKPSVPRIKPRERSRSVDLGVIATQRMRRENTLAERWEPPSLFDDPVTFPLSLVKRFTVKRRGDTHSLRYDDNGDLTRASTRDLFLHLITCKDSEYARHFLLGANYFLDPMTLLQLFVLFYRAPSAKNEKMTGKIRDSILHLLEQWISTQYATLKSSKKWVDLFERFVEYLKRGKEPDSVSHGERLHRYWQGIKLSKLIDVPKIKTPKDELPPTNMVFTDIDPSDLARQLTLKEQQYFHSIPLSEYYKLAWTKENARILAPNLLKIIARFNAVSFWVATTITAKIGVNDEEDLSPKERAQLLSYWIRVLDKLVSMHNYNSAMQIYSALNMTPVERLKATWASVPRSDIVLFEAFAAKLQSNFKGYRDDLEFIMLPDGTVERPCIPLHSLVLRDLSMVEEMDDFGTDGTVNWSKIALLASAFHTIQGFRSKKYTFSEDKAIQALLWHTSAISDDSLYERAAEISAAHSKFKWKSNSTKIQMRKGSSTNLLAPQPPSSMSTSSKTSFSLPSSASDSDGPSVQHTTSSPSLSMQPIVRRESLANMRTNMKRPRASSDGGNGDSRMLSVSTPPPASPKLVKSSSSKPLKSPKVDSTERKRSRSIREVLFGGGHKKADDDPSQPLPVKFVDVPAGSDLYLRFKSYLEKRYVAEHLEVYTMIEKVEGGSDWSPEEVRLACEGLCSRYLGTGDDPELIPVDEMVLENIKERLVNPNVTMFKELKRAVSQTLEEHYGNFVESGGVASDLRSKSSPSKKDSPRKDNKESPRGSPAKIKTGSVADKGRSQSKLAMHISSSSSSTPKRGTERLDASDERGSNKKW